MTFKRFHSIGIGAWSFLVGTAILHSPPSAYAKQKNVVRDSFLYNCQEKLWSSQLLRANIYPGDWMTLEEVETRSGNINAELKRDIKSSCSSNRNVRYVGGGLLSKRLFNQDCQDTSYQANNPFPWKLDYLSEFKTKKKNFVLFTIRANDGTRVLCLADEQLTYTPVQIPESGYIRNIERLYKDHPVWQYEFHPGNGWGYTVTKYQLNMKNPRRPRFSIVDTWTQQR